MSGHTPPRPGRLRPRVATGVVVTAIVVGSVGLVLWRNRSDDATTTTSGASAGTISQSSGAGTAKTNSSSSHTSATKRRVSSHARQVDSWLKRVRNEYVAVAVDVGAASKAVATSDGASLKSACADLKKDTARFQAGPRAPDTQIRRDVSRALGDFSISATSCLKGKYKAFSSSANSGTSSLDKATARLKKVVESG